MGFPALNKEVVVLVNCYGWNGIDGTARLLESCDRVEVDGMEAMTFHDVLFIGLLEYETQ